VALSTLVAFAVAFFVFAASPGPDNMAIMARTVSHGPWAGVAYGLGTVTGVLIFLTLAAFGLSLAAAKMGALMTALRYGGAAYLIWMGVGMWRAQPAASDAQRAVDGPGLVATYATGVALNLGNPKMPLFYVALLPNVVGAALTLANVGTLAAIVIAVEVVVVGGQVFLALRARQLLASPRVARRVNRVAGGVMIGAGVAVAASRRVSLGARRRSTRLRLWSAAFQGATCRV
jgi:threonine/homoserine/homoserine lactone efflux protein